MKLKVEGVTGMANGQVEALYLQEFGVKELPDAIGSLTAIRVLHAYGDGKQRGVRRTQNKLTGPGK
jgi:hypothetical protein